MPLCRTVSAAIVMADKRTISSYRTGRWVDQFKFRYYVPSPLSEGVGVDDAQTAMMLADASYAVGRLDGYLRGMGRTNPYLRHLWTCDALSWLRSEGVELTFEEYHMPDGELTARKRARRDDTRRYVSTMEEALAIMSSSGGKLSVRALRAVHKQLMVSSEGINRIPGMFRVEHTAVGGATLQDADYVPPHPDEIQQLMSNFDEFIQSDKKTLNPLVRVAMAHLQFLNIHPFADYNGRIVRLMTSLMLCSEGMTLSPAVFVGRYIENHRRIYFDRMNTARSTGDMVPWVKFMAVGVQEGAQEAYDKITAAESLVGGLQDRMSGDKRRAENSAALLRLLCERVAVCARDVMEALDITMPTAGSLIEAFVEAGILEETTGQKKNRVYLFRKLCDIMGAQPAL